MGWRWQWPLRWPITFQKPALPDPDTLRYPDYCNNKDCAKLQWVYRATKKRMGYCYEHLQAFDWVPKDTEPEIAREYERGQWRDKGAA